MNLHDNDRLVSITLGVESDDELDDFRNVLNEYKKDNSRIQNNNQQNSKKIKGILKNSQQDDSDGNIDYLLRYISLTIIFIFIVPLVFGDLYFVFTDTTCKYYEPKELTLSVGIYLLVSGFMGIMIIISYLTGICLFYNNQKKIKYANFGIKLCISFIVVIITLFNSIWNIIGAILFWGIIYNDDVCGSDISTYLSISLVIKLVSNLFTIVIAYRSDY